MNKCLSNPFGRKELTMPDKNKPAATKSSLALLYMTPSKITARDIAALLNDMPNLAVELWEAMNVLEIELTNKNTVDFEPVDLPFPNPSDAAFAKNCNISTVFAVLLSKEDLGTMKPCFEQLISQYSGFLCADSDDFTPVYAGSTKR
jgi:hypothetical protein